MSADLEPLAEAPLLTSHADGVLTIRLNRPRARNAINWEMRRLLRSALSEAAEDPEVAVVVLAGDDRAFCSGGDTKQMGRGQRDTLAKLDMAAVIVQTIATMPQPVVAAVRGHAAGAGFSLALACDLVVVDPSAVFTASFVERGLVPDMGGSFWLARQIGLHRAKDIFLSGRPVSAQEAFELGFAARLWPAETFDAELGALSAELAGRSTLAIGLLKRMLNRSFESNLLAALDAERLAQLAASDVHESQPHD